VIRPEGLSTRQCALWARLDALVHVLARERVGPQPGSIRWQAPPELD